MKSFLNAVMGMAVLSALLLCAIGGTGYLCYDGHYLFAVAEIVVVAFAAKPMYHFIQKNLLL